MRSRDDSELQRYHDGELSPRRARRVRQWLERDPLARQRRDSLQQLHELVASGAEGAADDADFSRLWQGVAQGIAAKQDEPDERGFRSVLGWIALGVSATAAVTLALFIWLAVPPPSNDCVIESLEVGPSAVSTIFTIADSETRGETTVIWVTDRTGEGSLE
jgi:anti-sigma factor RsiW